MGNNTCDGHDDAVVVVVVRVIVVVDGAVVDNGGGGGGGGGGCGGSNNVVPSCVWRLILPVTVLYECVCVTSTSAFTMRRYVTRLKSIMNDFY